MTGNLSAALTAYALRYPHEADHIARFRQLLIHPDAFERFHLPGHITGSAFIISDDGTKTLLVHHGKLNRWLQPGGHCDGDADVTRVAMREAMEETGLMKLLLDEPGIFDLDIHRIPARADFPAHDHYDVRYLLRGSLAEKVVVSEESHDVRWVELSELEKYNQEPALLRLRAKLSGRGE